MNIWTSELQNIIKLLFGNAGKATDIEIAVCAVAAVILAIFALKWAGNSFGFAMADRGRSTAVIAVWILLALAATAAINIYAAPLIKNPALVKWIPVAACALILLILIVPLAMVLLKSKYLQTLLAMLISIGAAAGIVLLVHGALGMASQGGKDFKKTKERTDSINEIIGK